MKLLHVGLIVADLEAAAAFYEGVLGLARIPRPELGFDGIFYDVGNGQEIHLMRLANPYTDAVLPEHGGRDRHIALQAADLDDIKRRLQAAGVPYSMSKSGRAALFCRDPDGNAIELCELPASG